VNRLIPAILAAFVLAASGCSAPTIDTSSDEAMKASAQKVRESLPEDRRAEFDEAVQLLVFSQIGMAEVLAGGALGAASVESRMKSSLDGKTAEEVIAEAARIRAERQAREREQALAEISELEAKRVEAEKGRELLKAFEVVRSRFYVREERFSGKQPIIELTVKNGTGSPISRAHFNGIIASPNRSVPWHKDDFNYSIKGGLEHGEEASWSLAPNRFSGWGSVDAPADAVFTVTVERLDGPDGKALFSAAGFDERAAKRLSELKSRYGIEEVTSN
jgi:hypothetical protein